MNILQLSMTNGKSEDSGIDNEQGQRRLMLVSNCSIANYTIVYFFPIYS